MSSPTPVPLAAASDATASGREKVGGQPEEKSDRRGFGSRVLRVVVQELDLFSPKKIVVTGLTQLIPQLSFNVTRTAILRAAGMSIGRRSLVMGPLHVTGRTDFCDLVSIGEETMITGPLHIDLASTVRIGNRVNIGHYVSLITADHRIGAEGRRCAELLPGPIVIEDGAWIASHVKILPGVTVGAFSVVATGAVVTRDVPPNTIVGGVPARVIRDIEEEAVSSARPTARDGT
jgi:acetyltransferase-like isoleucine patch superfamily enzyme